MQVWVTRDSHDDTSNNVTLRAEKPTSSECYEWFTGGGSFGFMAVGFFKKYFKFTPRKGSCKQYNLTLTEVKE